MTRYLLTSEVLATELWAALETNPAYSQNLTNIATVAKNAAGTYFKYRPGVTVTATGDFPAIANAKSGWRITNGIGNTWVEVAPQLGVETIIYVLAVLGTKLYGGTYPNGKLYEWNGSNAWVEVAPKLGAETVIYALAVLGTKLYGGTNPNGKLLLSNMGAAFNGSFAAGNWTFKGALYNNTKYGHAVKIAARLSRSTNLTGANATIIGAVTENTTTTTLAASAGDIQTFTWTYNPGAVTLTNEYLFVEFRCVIVTAASNASANHSFIEDEDPATRDESVTPTTFTGGSTPLSAVIIRRLLMRVGL